VAQKTIQSLEKGLDILFLFTEDRPLLTLEEISSLSRMPKSTCYRFLNTLKKKEILELDRDQGKYRLSVRFLRFESAILNSIDLAKLSLPFLRELSKLSGETAQLVVLNNNVGVCIEKVESTETLRVMPDKGTIIGLHGGASGKVIMAYLSEEEQDWIIREKGLTKFTPNTISDPRTLKKHLQEIRKRGYAVSDGEIYAGVKAFAAPVFNYRGKITASISLAGPRERFKPGKITSILNPLQKAADDLSRELGSKFKYK
jgi:IclR family KDG regulon transcriptional repressor